MDFAFIWMQIYLYLGLLTQEEIDSQNFKTWHIIMVTRMESYQTCVWLKLYYRMNFESIFFIKMMLNHIKNLMPLTPNPRICPSGKKFNVSFMIEHSRSLPVHSMWIGAIRCFWKFMTALGKKMNVISLCLPYAPKSKRRLDSMLFCYFLVAPGWL
jgi:hypothetical protein